MATGLSDPRIASTMDMAMRGGSSTRGFWTKRKRTATSLVAVMGLLAGIAVAFKLFEQTVPNNVVRDASSFAYVITAQDVSAGETAFHAVDGAEDRVIFRQSLATQACSGQQPPVNTSEACNMDSYPGDTRRSDVIIKNIQTNPAKTASFEMYVDTESIVITKYNRLTNSYTVVSPTGPASADYSRYLSFWRLNVDKQAYFAGPTGEVETNSYTRACVAAGLKEFTKQQPCKLGQIKSAGTQGAAFGPFTAKPTDDRQYRFFMNEMDDGTDQSNYQGWRVTFSLVFSAKLPADGELDRNTAIPS